MANVYVRSGASGSNNGTSKTDAYTTLAAAFTASAAGDVFYVASDHAESQSSAMTLTPPGSAASWSRVLCVDFAGSTPPVAADLRTTATITTTGANAMTIATGYCYWRGVTLSSASGAVTGGLVITGGAGMNVMENCSLTMPNTGTAVLALGTTGQASQALTLINTTLGFGSVNHSISLRNIRYVWKGTASAIRTDGSFVVPTELFKTSTRSGTAFIEGVDLSAAGSGKTLVGANTDPCQIYFKDCKYDASVTVATTPASPSAGETYVTSSDSGATNYRSEKYAYQGTQTTDTSIIRTGGASNGVTGYSSKFVSTANATVWSPFEALPAAIFNSTTGSSVTATIYGVWNSANLPNNDEFWVDIEALATSGNPLGVFATGGKASILASGSALTASTQAWDSNVTARANSTAYTVGDVRKVASNSGRIFFCTTSGTSAGSEPAGYASAVDGGSVTDGTAVFRAARRFSIAVSITPRLAGPIYVYPKVGLASATFYMDPKPVLS